MKRIAILLALATVALAVPPVGEAHFRLKGSHACKKDVNTATDIRARKMRCRYARKVVRQYLKGDTTPRGFSCVKRSRIEGDSKSDQFHTEWRCRRGRRKGVVFAAY